MSLSLGHQMIIFSRNDKEDINDRAIVCYN